MWTTIFFALLAILCVLSLMLAAFAARNAARTTALPRAELASIASKLRSIELNHLEMVETVTKLAHKYKMQKVRNAVDHVSDPMSVDEALSVKDQLRKKAGLIAGQPAKHN